MRTLHCTAVALLAMGAGVAGAEPLELDEAQVFVELNHTDGDLGLHANIDGGPYTRLEIEDPRGRRILLLKADGRLARQGLTQLMIESAEPDFDALPPERFFKRFPEGLYEVEIERGGKEAEAEVFLSHVLAAPPSGILVSGIPAAEDCEDEAALPVVAPPVTVSWDPVTASHPEIGASGPVEIAKYQFFIDQEDPVLAVDLPPTLTEFQIPASLTAGGEIYKFEILARTSEGNNTAVESCFMVIP